MAQSNKRRSTGAALVKGVIGLAVVGVVGGGAWIAMGRSDAGPTQAPDLFRVSSMSFNVTATGNGDLRARNQTPLRSELENTSQIVEIVPEGTSVEAGDLLVRLNADSIKDELDNEMLSYESAKSDLISAENSYQIQVSDNESALRKALLDVELKELDLRKWQEGELQETRVRNKLAIEKAEREYERLQNKVERSRELFANGFLSNDELDQDELAFVEAQSNLQTARLASEVYEKFTYDKDLKQKTSDVEEARAEVDRVKRKNDSELASREAARTNRRRQLTLREERVSKLQSQLEAATIHAPNDGLVVYATSVGRRSWRGGEDPLDVGSDIRPNQEIILLPDTSEMIAAVKISESMLGRVRPGQPAIVTIDAAQGRKFPGRVESIGVMAQTGGWRDPNVREYEVRIALELGDEPHKLKPSMRCEAEIILDEVDESLAVPIQAVFNEGRNRFVYTTSGDRFAQTPVQVGRRSDAYAEILGGLDSGTDVLLREPAPGLIVKAEFPEPDAPRTVQVSGGAPASGGAAGGKPAAAGAGAGGSESAGRKRPTQEQIDAWRKQRQQGGSTSGD